GKFWFCNTRYRYQIYPSESSGKETDLINYQRETGINQLKTPDGKDMLYFLSIIEDNQQNLWLVTYDAGVWRYDGKTCTHYAVKDGSKDITLFSIYKDNRGDLWLGTHESGVYKFNGTAFEKFRP
ncbi:MAG: two-component regulator propeller domain-containing protein, partial [Saprospiraceae bacterium]